MCGSVEAFKNAAPLRRILEPYAGQQAALACSVHDDFLHHRIQATGNPPAQSPVIATIGRRKNMAVGCAQINFAIASGKRNHIAAWRPQSLPNLRATRTRWQEREKDAQES